MGVHVQRVLHLREAVWNVTQIEVVLLYAVAVGTAESGIPHFPVHSTLQDAVLQHSRKGKSYAE
jgi:hypothetical protein